LHGKIDRDLRVAFEETPQPRRDLSTPEHDRHREPTQIFTFAEAAPGLVSASGGTLWLTRGDDVDIILAITGCVEIEAAGPAGAIGLGTLSTTATSVQDANSFARAT
jgi:hypothetical protein